MRIGKLSNGISCEYEMQDKFKIWLENKNIKYIDEHYVSEIKRRADFLIYYDSKLINIEAKCNNHKTLIKQLKDHAKYCDYCYAFIPDYTMTPKWFKKDLLKFNFGLIVYNYDNKAITEVLEAHHNKPKNKLLRKNIINFFKQNDKISVKETINKF